MERPIFIVGCPRSGTTLVQLMLHAHPRIAIPPETRFLLPAYFRRQEFGDLRTESGRRALGRWIVGEKEGRFPDLGLDAEAVVAEIMAAPPTIGSVLGTVLRAYARSHGKPRWGDKRPTYVRYLPELHRLFPDAQFVHVVRDGRDCVGSLKQMPWWKQDSYYSMATWAQAVDSGHAAGRRLSAGSYYELQYESLVADPARELTALCGFLGEAFDTGMLRPYQLASVPVSRKKHHARTRGAVDTAAVRTWENRLEPWEATLAEHVLGGRLESYGHELSGLGRPSPAHLARYLGTLAKARTEVVRRNSRDALRRFGEDDVACALVEATDYGRVTRAFSSRRP
ncbi:MAG: sulfotransferase [Streptosporangiaceae bacterium]